MRSLKPYRTSLWKVEFYSRIRGEQISTRVREGYKGGVGPAPAFGNTLMNGDFFGMPT